jgi:biopolymer transport protein ExbD
VKQSRRLKRMSRKKKTPGLNLTSLMDVFTILVFFLLVNSGSSEVLEPPKEIELPDSTAETKPRETVLVMISGDTISIQGDPVITTGEVLNSKDDIIEAIRQRLADQQKKVIGLSTQAVAESKEVTVLADRVMPFKLLKKVMASCTSAGYSKISLAVLQVAAEKG